MPYLVAVPTDVVLPGVFPLWTPLHQHHTPSSETHEGQEVERHALGSSEGVAEVVEQRLVDYDVSERHYEADSAQHEDEGPADEVLGAVEPVSEAEHKAAHCHDGNDRHVDVACLSLAVKIVVEDGEGDSPKQ